MTGVKYGVKWLEDRAGQGNKGPHRPVDDAVRGAHCGIHHCRHRAFRRKLLNHRSGHHMINQAGDVLHGGGG